MLAQEFLVFLIKIDLLFEIVDNIFAVVDQHEEILPEVKIVLSEGKNILFTWISIVFFLQKSHKLRTVVVGIIDIVLVAISQMEILPDVEILLFCC